jgi:CheY-like chemotaxis protein/HPt (histidine-containing phosphotransfer) domain-containing protein
VVEVLGVRAQEKGVALRFECTTPIPEMVLTDPVRMRQIVTNLVGNAIKFTERGAVKVLLGVRPDGEREVLCIDVQDSGVGIPADKLESIFEPFVQAEASTTRRFGGTGLGLTISRRFARALGGDIKAASQAGKGSVFMVTLDPGPLQGVRRLTPAQASSALAAATATESAKWVFPPARVLVVDDGEENRELVRLVLEEAGLQVGQAENGKVGVEMALQEGYDVVLMDVQMPVMDGTTATRVLRQRGMAKPIIALTANAMKGFERELGDAGFTAYLTKPVDIDRLLQTLAPLLGGQRQAVQAPGRAGAPGAAGARGSDEGALKGARSGPITELSRPAASTARVVSRLAEHPRLRAVVRKFAVQMPERMQLIERAWEMRNFADLAALAHWLKGSGGTAGYDAFTAPARELELVAKAGDEAQAGRLVSELRVLVDAIEAPDAIETLAKAG